jgi:hypothetical protein
MANERTQVIGLRVNAKEAAVVAKLQAATAQSEQSTLRELIPDDAWSTVLIAHAGAKMTTPARALYALAAEGLRSVMTRSNRGIKRQWLDSMTLDSLPAVFAEWRDGLATELGQPGILGNRFRLVDGPNGSLPERIAPTATVASLLDALRSPDMVVRIDAGKSLALSIGAGLKLAGETAEDVDNIIGPQLSAILGRAMAGESSAVDELAALVTTDQGRAHRPTTVKEPAPRGRRKVMK